MVWLYGILLTGGGLASNYRAAGQHTKHLKSIRAHRNVLYHRPMGRMGNQLFQYASLLGISKQHNMIPCFEGVYLSNWFDGVRDGCTVPKSLPTVGENGRFATFNTFSFNESTTIEGFLQSHKYFQNNVDVQRIYFKSSITAAAETVLKPLRKRATRLVGIHVRRGDLIQMGYIHEAPTANFANAMRLLGGDNAFFVVVSDDIMWCTQQSVFTPNNVKILERGSAPVDMAVLAACDDIIMSIGTFGWWAAYLGAGRRGGHVTYYANEFNMAHATTKGNVVADDYYPRNWWPVL